MSEFDFSNYPEADENGEPSMTVTFELVGDDREAMRAWVAATLKSAREAEGFDLDDWSLDPHDGSGPR